jgi:hypothetical protein
VITGKADLLYLKNLTKFSAQFRREKFEEKIAENGNLLTLLGVLYILYSVPDASMAMFCLTRHLGCAKLSFFFNFSLLALVKVS